MQPPNKTSMPPSKIRRTLFQAAVILIASSAPMAAQRGGRVGGFVPGQTRRSKIRPRSNAVRQFTVSIAPAATAPIFAAATWEGPIYSAPSWR